MMEADWSGILGEWKHKYNQLAYPCADGLNGAVGLSK